jgi:hypothetical protein
VLFVDYLTIMPLHGEDRGGSPPAEIAEWGRAIAARLATTTQAAAEAAGCEYVAASAARHAWSAIPWILRFHLSLRGGRRTIPTRPGWRPSSTRARATRELMPSRRLCRET